MFDIFFCGTFLPHASRIIVADMTNLIETASPAISEPLSGNNLWVAFGFLAQAMFFGRFLLQWIASERRKECVVPVGFWWLSVVGGVMLFFYAVHRRDPVFIAGQGCGMLIYLRNLYFIYAKRLRVKPANGEGATPV